MSDPIYDAQAMGGKKEEKMMTDFQLQRDEAKRYFENYIKPRLDRSYKLYVAYNGDRAKEIQKWQANIFVSYIQSVVETLMPRILDARPEFTVKGRNEDDQMKQEKLQQLQNYTWEIAKMDQLTEMFTRSALVYGMGYMQVKWKQDKRKLKFLKSAAGAKKYKWVEETKTYYDAPSAEWVDPYDLWYDWHNIESEDKQYWFKRRLLPESVIRRVYPNAQEKRLKMAFNSGAGNLKDYASIRREVKQTQEGINKGDDWRQGGGGEFTDDTTNNDGTKLQRYEVFEWWRPFDDKFSVIVDDVPILKGAEMPCPYDFKESPFISVPYLKLPHEFEGLSLPLILENPQIMLNMIKNQRLDATTMSIHKMWIVNPLANIDKTELVTRPFGIIYSPDPNGAREIQFSDIKPSAYKEEESLKSDMRYASGVDDFSMGSGGGGASATEVRHLRESTLERVRLFVNHLGYAYSDVLRYWTSLWRQFMTKSMKIRILGEDGAYKFPIIEKDDLMGEFDFISTVIPSFAGKNDLDKKQALDLFQLLQPLPEVDQRKLMEKVLHSYDWSLDSVAIDQDEAQKAQEEQMAAMSGQQGQQELQGFNGKIPGAGGAISADVMKKALGMLGGEAPPQGQFAEASTPIDLTKQGGAMPPTARDISGSKSQNLRGLNKGGKVNTNPGSDSNGDDMARLLGKSQSLQRKK